MNNKFTLHCLSCINDYHIEQVNDNDEMELPSHCPMCGEASEMVVQFE